MKMSMKAVLLSAAATLVSVGFGKTLSNGFTYAEDGDIVPGEWNSQYTKAVEYAKENDCPIVAFWANPNCGYCNKLEKAITESKTFATWAQERGYVLVFGYGVSGDNYKTKSFAYDMSGKFPYIGLGWNGRMIGTAKGTVHAHGTEGVDYRLTFSGRPGYLPGSGSDLADIFMSSCDKYLSGYSPVRNSAFTAPDTAGNRLECEANTTSVAIELVRDSAKKELMEKFVIVNAKGVVQTHDLVWAVGETAKTNVITFAEKLPAAPQLKALGTSSQYTVDRPEKDGEQLTFKVLNDEGEEMAVTHVTYVEKDAGAANPRWIGEAFGFGEWTCDIDGAKDLVAKAEGAAYTLVSVQGSMWCPDCANTDRNFLEVTDKDGNNLFAAWAKEKNIALVSMDIPNYNGPTVADRATPTLFSTDAYATALARNTYTNGIPKETPAISGADPVLTNKIVRSGLGYQTRKGMTAAQAEAQLVKFHDLAYNNTDKGGFHRPEDGNKNRPGVPIFVLLRKDGSVAARFTRFAAVSPMAADKANFANYIKRFEEMLKLADEDATEIVNNFPSKDHLLLMQANGDAFTSTLCNADFQDAVKLVGLTGSATQSVSVKGDSDASVVLQPYVMTADGTVATVGNSYTCAKLSEGLTFSFTAENTTAAEYFVLVKGKDITSAAFDAASAVDNHFISYTLTGSTQYLPVEAAQTGMTDANGQAVVTLVSNQVYRITNVDPDACAGILVPVEGDFYVAAKDGACTLGFKTGESGRTDFECQLWKSGAVGFVETEDTVTESVNDKDNDYCQLRMSRTGGVSGDVRVEVSLDPETDLYNVEYDEEQGKVVRGSARFEFATTNIVWKDGDGADKFVLVRVLDDSDQPRFDGNGKIVLRMGTPTSPAMDVGVTNAVFTLNVEEDDRADAGRAMFSRVEPYYGKAKTVYARESDGAKLWANRIEGSEGLFAVEVKSSLAGVEFATENPRDLTNDTQKAKTLLMWSNKESGEKYLAVSKIPAGKSAKVSLNAYKSGSVDAKVVSGDSVVTVVSVADDAPSFEKNDVAETLYRYVAVSNTVKVLVADAEAVSKLTFAKLSGSLPTGLKAVYDPALPGLAIVGTPTATDTRTGVKSFEAVYQVTEERLLDGGKKKVPGLTIRLAYEVVDPAVTGGETGEPINDFFTTSRTYSDLLVLDPGSGSLFGTLTLTLPRTGKASAKLKCAFGTLAYSAKSWSGLEVGNLKVTLTGTTKGYESSVITVTAADTGALAVEVTGISGETWTLSWGKFWSNEDSAKDYQGTYTVALPLREITDDPCGLAPRGTPYLSLKMTSASQWNAGKMTWAGVLANGTKVSGSAVLTESPLAKSEAMDLEAGGACLPIFAQSKKDVFGAVALIAKGAKARSDKSEAKECYRAVSAPVFQTVELGDIAVKPYWTHTENSKTVTNAVWDITYDLFGSIYNLKNGLDCCCEEMLGTRYLTLQVSTNVVSTTYGQVGPVQDVELEVTAKTISLDKDQLNPQKVTFSVNSSGIASGSFKLPYVDQGTGASKTLSATFNGVVLIGWGADCGECHEGEEIDLPFIMGGWTFTDKYADETTGKTISVKTGDAIEGKKLDLAE